MPNSGIRHAAATNPPVVSDLVGHHARPTMPIVDDIVARALAVLDEESRDWLQGERRRDAISERMGPDPGSAS
jgi:hypothetical protein